MIETKELDTNEVSVESVAHRIVSVLLKSGLPPELLTHEIYKTERLNDEDFSEHDWEFFDGAIELILSSVVWKQHLAILGITRVIQRNFLTLGMELSEFDKFQRWRAFGHPSFNSYVSSPGVDIKVGTGYRVRDVYRFFIETHDIANGLLIDARISKLDTIRAVIKSKNVSRETVIEWVVLASTITRDALIVSLYEEFGDGNPADDISNIIYNGSYGGQTRAALSDLLSYHLGMHPNDTHPSVVQARELLEIDLV